MKINVVSDFFELLEKDTLSFMYQGAFTDEITSMVIGLNQYYLYNEEYIKFKNRISFLMIECFQNIIRHGSEIKNHKTIALSDNMFFTRIIDKLTFICSVNPIHNDEIEQLCAKIERINNLNPDELKEFQTKVLREIEMSAKGGASLGLIEMARKSGQKLKYDFVPISETHSHFYLQVSLNTKSVNSEVDLSIPRSVHIHKLLRDNNIFILQKGNFSQESIKAILRMVDKNMYQVLNKIDRIPFHLMVEMLQNISKHALILNDNREGLFLTGEENGKFFMGTANFVANKSVESLNTKLKDLKFLNDTQLVELYKKVLLEGETTEGGGAGLGTIDLFRYSNIEHLMIPYDNEKTLYCLLARPK